MNQTVGSCPLDCPDACSWVVTTDDAGDATRLRGNPDHPFTAGGLCKKVNSWLEYARDPSRILTPQRRVGPKGAPTFEPISWDDAIAEIADRFTEVRRHYGGEAIWPFVGTGNVGFLQGSNGGAGSRLWNALGASHHQVSICSPSGHAGLGYTVGTAAGLDPEDVVAAGLIIVWGANPLVTNQHFWPFVERARSAGAEVVVIDPVRTRTAERVEWHVAPRPGTDGALALGLCRAVLDRGGVDDRFVAERVLGFDEFVELLDRWPVAHAAEVCDVSEAEIDRLADAVVSHPPVAIKLGQGMQRHAAGGQAARTISCLAALTGAFDQPGGGVVYATSPAYGLNRTAAHRPDLRPHSVRSLAQTNLGRNLLELDDPPVKALFMFGANPMVSNPQIELVRRGLLRHDLFTVVVELYPTETVAYADLVLPSTMQHEQTEINDSFAHLYLNWNEPAVDPPGECRSHTDIFRQLAAALAEQDPSIDDPALHATDHELAAAWLDTDSYRQAGITVDRLRTDGFVRIPGTAPYKPFVDRFPTPSGRLELVSERAGADGHGRLPDYRPPDEASTPADGRYALVAIGSDWHINSVFAGTDLTRSRTGEPPLVIHPADAERDGLVDGMRVEASNERGRFTARLAVSDRARPGVATMTKGWWGQGINATVVERDSDMWRGAVYHDNVVAIRPAVAASSGSS